MQEDLWRRALEAVNEKEVVNELAKLIKIPSRNPPGEEKELAEYIVDRLSIEGINAKLIYEPYKDRPQVVAVIKGSGSKSKLVVEGHMDVVPEGDTSKWKYPPFEGIVDDGKVYGRGACDTKGGIVSTIYSAILIKRLGIKLRGDLILQFAVGEEKGEPGAKRLLELGYTGDYGIVLEPTSLRVATAIKGITWIQIEFFGKQAHASMPELGANAIDLAVEFANKLKEYKEEIAKKVHPLVGSPKIAITMISAGVKENIIPEYCKLSLDRRIIPSEKIEQVENEIRGILESIKKNIPEMNYKLVRSGNYEAAEIPTNEKIADILRKNVKKITGKKQKPFGLPAGTDMRNFINDANIPTVTWGPGNLSQAHTTDEWVEIKQLVQATKILILTYKDLLA